MLTLPSGQLIKIKAIINGQEKEINIGTKIAEIAPNLSIPSVIDVIRNTSVSDPTKFSNVQFRALAKSKPKVTYNNGKVVVEPGKLERNGLKILITQIAPSRIAEVFELNDIDLDQDDWQDAAAKQIASWLTNLGPELEVNALENLVYSAQEFQKKIIEENSSYTTFKKGAHLETFSELTPDICYNILSDIKNSMSKIGLSSAKTNIDKTFLCSNGIPKSDLIVMVSPEFLDTLMQRPGMFASDSGIEIFKLMNIRIILGLNVVEMATMPDGVHVIAVTTGKLGAYGKGSVAGGNHYCYRDDPTWSKNKIIEVEKSFYSGVVYEQLIFAATEEGKTFEKPILSSAIEKGKSTHEVDTFDLSNIPNNGKNRKIDELSKDDENKIKESLNHNNNNDGTSSTNDASPEEKEESSLIQKTKELGKKITNIFSKGEKATEEEVKAVLEEILAKETLTPEEEAFIKKYENLAK